MGEHGRNRRGVNPSGHGYGNGCAFSHGVLFTIVTFYVQTAKEWGDLAQKTVFLRGFCLPFI
jgi:hypothetical protein